MSDNAGLSDRLWVISDEEYAVMEDFLDNTGYGTLRQWAIESDYVLDDEEYDGWIDEDGNPVDLFVQLWIAIEASKQAE